MSVEVGQLWRRIKKPNAGRIVRVTEAEPGYCVHYQFLDNGAKNSIDLSVFLKCFELDVHDAHESFERKS